MEGKKTKTYDYKSDRVSSSYLEMLKQNDARIIDNRNSSR